MRTKFKLFVPLIAFNFLFLFGCQKEIDQKIEAPLEEVFTQESLVAELVQRTALRDGSSDNIIDGSSCTSIVLPITVNVNGLDITLDSKEDFITVENILDKFDDDDDIMNILFPVTVILADHSELVLQDESDLEDLIDQCIEGGADDDIECVDFKFPLNISVFDSENQVSNVITITDDKKLHDFIHDLDENDIAGFNFPVTVVLSDGAEMIISNNDELEDILKNAVDDCDEDDDNDHDEDDVDDTDLVNVLIDGDWAITYFFDDKDETSDFAGYVFTFLESGMVQTKKGENVVEGSWYSNGDDGELELELDFGEHEPLDELQDDWDMIEFDGTIIKLKDISGGDGTIEYLTFERPSGDSSGGEQSSVSEFLVVGKWIVANYDDSGENNTAIYNGFQLDFMADGKVTATKSEDVLNGTWSVTASDGIDKLVLDFSEQAPFNEFNDDWDIEAVTETRIDLKDVSGGDGSVDKLVLERL